MNFFKKLLSRKKRRSESDFDIEYVDSTMPPDLTEGRCCDKNCPCPPPGTVIPKGTGYMYISQELVDLRKEYPRIEDARRATQLKLLEKNKDIISHSKGDVVIEYDGIGGILVCKQGATIRNLDMEVASRDAKHWWKTNQIPLRATPTKKSSPPDFSAKHHINESLENHFNRIVAKVMATNNSLRLKKLLEEIHNPSVVDFTVQTIYESLKKSISEKKQYNTARQFGDTYLVVSTVPATGTTEIKSYFSNRYTSFMDEMIKESDYSNGIVNLAHWVFCYDGGSNSEIYLTFLPALNLLQDSESDVGPLVAEEKKRVRS